jgi:hypothetical protein
MGPSPGPTRGVVQVYVTPPFHALGLYHAFPRTQTSHPTEYCEIFWTHGHVPRQCPIMQDYMTMPNTIHYELYASTTHATNQCRVLDAVANILDWTTFRINETP